MLCSKENTKLVSTIDVHKENQVMSNQDGQDVCNAKPVQCSVFQSRHSACHTKRDNVRHSIQTTMPVIPKGIKSYHCKAAIIFVMSKGINAYHCKADILFVISKVSMYVTPKWTLCLPYHTRSQFPTPNQSFSLPCHTRYNCLAYTYC